jgi:hypothetical protein
MKSIMNFLFSSQGFRQCTAALLRSGADPDVANAGRTPLMEATQSCWCGNHPQMAEQFRLVNYNLPRYFGYFWLSPKISKW